MNDGLGDGITFDTFIGEMQRLEDSNDPVGAQDRLDAKRYRFLRDSAFDSEKMLMLNNENPEPATPQEFDAVIDAVMLKSSNVKLRGSPASGRVPLQRRVRWLY